MSEDEYIQSVAREAVAILPRSISSQDKSYAGGDPLWPVGIGWPTDSRGVECVFLAQFDLLDLPSKPAHFPDDGVLYIFMNSLFSEIHGQRSVEPILYYASADTSFEIIQRTTVISKEEYLLHEDHGTATKSLPKVGLDMIRFVEACVPHEFQFADVALPPDLKEYLLALDDEEYEELVETRNEVNAAERRSVMASGNDTDQLENLPERLHTKLRSGQFDQLFGYGLEIQTETAQHIQQTLICSLEGPALPGINFGSGNLKIWLDQDSLIPNAWQRAVVENNTS